MQRQPQPPQESSEIIDASSSDARRSFIEYLQQQREIFRQREKQTSDVLTLLSQSRSRETANWNLGLNVSSNESESTSPDTSPTLLNTGGFFDDWSPEKKNYYAQDQFDEEAPERESDSHSNLRVDESPNRSAAALNLDDMPLTNEFVKKLYRMVEDPTFGQFTCWGPQGDYFVVKDMQECTRLVLPRLFKHSNFSSFIRQLNKYGFHKIKIPPADPQYGNDSWAFQHPNFKAGDPHALANVKRKSSASRKSSLKSIPTRRSIRTIPPGRASSSTSAVRNNPMQPRLVPAADNQSSTVIPSAGHPETITPDIESRLSTLERNHEEMINEIIGYQQGVAERNEIIQSLIMRFLQNSPDDGDLLSFPAGEQ